MKEVCWEVVFSASVIKIKLEWYKRPTTKLNLLERLDFHGELTSQLEWKRNPKGRPLRVVYGKNATPTAAILEDRDALVENALFWITCADLEEANYVMAIVNSNTLYRGVESLMTKGQFGPRNLQKHLWKLPIPEFDPGNGLHVSISEAGRRAAEGAAVRLAELYEERERVTVTIARRELRSWLRGSSQGRDVEDLVGGLLGSSV